MTRKRAHVRPAAPLSGAAIEWDLLASVAREMHLAPGLSVKPAGLTEEENRGLARQSAALAGRFVRAIRSAPDVGNVCYADERMP